MDIKLLFELHVGRDLTLQGVPFTLFHEQDTFIIQIACLRRNTPWQLHSVQDNNTKETSRNFKLLHFILQSFKSETGGILYLILPSTPINVICSVVCRVQLKCDGTRRRTGGELKGELANEVGSQYSSHYLGTWCITTADAHTSAASSRLNWRPRPI